MVKAALVSMFIMSSLNASAQFNLHVLLERFGQRILKPRSLERVRKYPIRGIIPIKFEKEMTGKQRDRIIGGLETLFPALTVTTVPSGGEEDFQGEVEDIPLVGSERLLSHALLYNILDNSTRFNIDLTFRDNSTEYLRIADKDCRFFTRFVYKNNSGNALVKLDSSGGSMTIVADESTPGIAYITGEEIDFLHGLAHELSHVERYLTQTDSEDHDEEEKEAENVTKLWCQEIVEREIGRSLRFL